MKKILVAYTTNSGTTADVAKAIGEELAKEDCEVDVRRMEEVITLDPYVGVVIGAPMIMGWHKTAITFIRKNEAVLSRKKVAYFITAMSLTKTVDLQDGVVPVYVDANLPKPPRNSQRLGFKERYARLSSYLKPVLKAAPHVHPVSIGFFGGSLELFRLKWWAMLFVMLVIQATPGDYRNWTAIREWAAGLRTGLLDNLAS
jgi:menaquinone-dependent protoporphyrinogen oxidase